MRFLNFRIFELSTALALGILANKWLMIPDLCMFGMILTWFHLGYVHLRDKNSFQPSIVFPILCFLLFLQLGFWITHYNERIYKYDTLTTLENPEKASLFVLEVEELGKSTESHHKIIANTLKKGNTRAHGRILVYLKRDSLLKKIVRNDRLIVMGALQPILEAHNPNQFDFKGYMERRGVHFTLFLESKDVFTIEGGEFSLLGFAEGWKSYLLEKLGDSPLHKDVLSITQALTLGERKSIDSDLYDAYSKAGAVHLLALSGLHIGILMLLLNMLFSFLTYFPRGRLYRSLLVVILLWGFALLTGFSPSVVRSVSMFSFLSFGQLANRPSQGINSLFLSFFIILVLAPDWLLDLGFQMSYLAVASILLLQPQFQKLQRPKIKIVRHGLDIASVSFSAQLGVAPLSLFHFHQFPGLFWFTNWILLPFMSFILLSSLVVLTLATIEIYPSLPFQLHNWMIGTMNNIIHWTSQQEAFVWKIKFDFPLIVIMCYLLILLFIFMRKAFLKRIIFLCLGIGLLVSINDLMNDRYKTQQLIWFQTKGARNLVIETRKETIVFSDDKETPVRNPLRGFLASKEGSFRKFSYLPGVFAFDDTHYVVIDSLGLYPQVENAVVILTYNPKVHLERLLQDLKPKLVIADGNNYQSSVARWKKSCTEKNIPFWSTREGAYIEVID